MVPVKRLLSSGTFQQDEGKPVGESIGCPKAAIAQCRL